MRKLVLLVGMVTALAVAPPAAGVITNGQLDGNRHPNVGALFAEFDPGSPGLDLLCTGTLISPDDFMTASHCTASLADAGVGPHDVWVTFDPEPLQADVTLKPTTTLLRGTYHTHPEFGAPGADAHDIAVVTLDAPYTAAAPARLAQLNQLSTMDLSAERFTTVGYGAARDPGQADPDALFFDGRRRFTTQGFSELTDVWLTLSTDPAAGNGGSCYGDSGGPHFLGDTDVIASTTSFGDMACRVAEVTYRVDTASARAFLGQFVALP
jgi:hypothetical protein